RIAAQHLGDLLHGHVLAVHDLADAQRDDRQRRQAVERLGDAYGLGERDLLGHGGAPSVAASTLASLEASSVAAASVVATLHVPSGIQVWPGEQSLWREHT